MPLDPMTVDQRAADRYAELGIDYLVVYSLLRMDPAAVTVFLTAREIGRLNRSPSTNTCVRRGGPLWSENVPVMRVTSPRGEEVSGVHVPADALYPAWLSRPDLPVPEAPGPTWARRLLGPREPTFAAADRRIGRLVALAAAGAIVTELLVDGAARSVVLMLLAGVAVYAVAGAVNLAVLRRRQAGFEPAWLAAQSDVLRKRRFDVLRFTASEPVRTPHGRRAVRRVYDLTRTDEVERLLALRDRAETDGLTVPVTVEFSYPAEDGVGLEQVRGELGSIHLEAGAAARVSFPTARYRLQPATERSTTFWVLGLPSVTVTRRDRLPVP